MIELNQSQVHQYDLALEPAEPRVDITLVLRSGGLVNWEAARSPSVWLAALACGIADLTAGEGVWGL